MEFGLQVSYPYLGKLCGLAIPCALTALDHWSPEVKVGAFVKTLFFFIWIERGLRDYIIIMVMFKVSF